MKAAGISGVVGILLLPCVALLGVATLISPSAAGSAGCLWAAGAPTVDALAVSGASPPRLTSQNTLGQTVTMNQRQLQRAAAIIAVGKSQNIPAKGQLIAVMAAITESSLRALSNTNAHPNSAHIPNDGDGDDHDSLGLFQMRPSTGWGTVENLMDPVWSARAFYGGPNGPNHGSPRGLLDLTKWQSMDPGTAAQAVEVSAYPDRYAINQPVAEKILTTLTGVTLESGMCGPAVEVPANLPPGFPSEMIAAAAKQLGTPYVWGGGTFNGPTGGGFDCSGLVLYAAYKASGGRIRLRHYSGAQIHEGRGIALSDKGPGDLIFFSYPGAGVPHHVAIYVGGNRILHAPHTGDRVRYGTIGDFIGQVITVRRLR
jgi:cell wall-associated NlpC family hydrolase